MTGIGGVLRCLTCGKQIPRVAAGLNYGFPKCCGNVMTVVTERQLQEEIDYYEKQEMEAHFLRSAGVENV